MFSQTRKDGTALFFMSRKETSPEIRDDYNW